MPIFPTLTVECDVCATRSVVATDLDGAKAQLRAQGWWISPDAAFVRCPSCLDARPALRVIAPE